MHDKKTGMSRDIQAYPGMHLGKDALNKRYRFNWNGPLIHNQVNPRVLYHGGNVLLRSEDRGMHWEEISPDLTRNDSSKQGPGGIPFTNEGAGGEVYNTISYIASSPHEEGTLWVGSDDGLVHVSRNEGLDWVEVSPPLEGEALINAIEVSPHDPAGAYLAVTRYKFDDHRPMIFYTGDYGENWSLIVKGLPEDQFVRVVREDPVAPGLLYAGTEHGLYVSFDRGSSWTRFQSNLPVTPITDLVIKDQDLVASTSGRGFWILDDLGALQQSMGQPDTTALALYAPKSTYRFSLGGGFEQGTVGQNPHPGVIFDYYLPHGLADSAVLSLEVLDAEGKVVRRLSSTSDSDVDSWPGGPRPPRLLPKAPGLNRSYWAMDREPIPAAGSYFIYGGYGGSMLGPGTYALRLNLEGQVAEQEVRLLADPRLEATAADWAKQQKLLEQLDQALREINQSVSRMAKVKAQLELKLEILGELDGQEALQELAEVTQDKLIRWEAHLIQPRQETFQDVINFENKLATEINYLRMVMDSYDPVVSQGQEQRSQEVLSQWDAVREEFKQLIEEDLAAFSEAYEAQKLPVILLPE